MPKVQAIFSDYDGTLCPLELRREDAFPSPRLRRLLTKASKRVPLGIITTKDLDFIKERIPFAQGISATCGLEMQVGDKVILDERTREPNKNLENAYRECVSKILQVRENIVIERKVSEEGDLLAFCLDWRLARNWEEAHRQAVPLLAFCREQGLYVVESEISPFANVYPMQIDKGTAFLKLKTEMGLTIILVEQDVKASLAASDMVYILHEGRIKAHGKAEDLGKSREIREAYLGI